MPCICGNDTTTESCCGAIIKGERPAQTAEELMRSRYSAYVMGEVDYIMDTHAPEAAEDADREAIEEWASEAEWLGFEVLDTAAGGAEDDEGEVEFICRFNQNGEEQVLHERSRFRRDEGTWRFVDGQLVKSKPIRREAPKVGRNDPCPCGSGKKFKRCCAS